ncbi:Por secretion system C-terminal sorting domain-containing protein, partial [Hymenobacter gelipurpurascens]
TVASPTVSGLVAGSYVFALVVTDSKGLPSSPSSVTVTVNPAPTSSGQQVVSFTLINADSDQPIRQLVANDVLNLATLPTKNLNIRANTSPTSVGSVTFVLSGAVSKTQTETAAPYALFADAGGNYYAWTPPLGSYSLKATPYSGGSGSGTAGTALTLAFSVTNQAARPAALTTATAAVAAPAAVEAYPNPSASGRFHLAFRAAAAGPVAYELISAVGATVGQGTLSLPAGSSEQVLELGGRLPAPGLYYLQLKGQRFSTTVKLIKQ